MEPLWLKHYLRDVPAEIDFRCFASFQGLLLGQRGAGR